MDEKGIPLRSQTAMWMRGGLKNRPGTLLLYSDQIHHVGSAAARLGMGFGAVGAVTGQLSAKAAAPKKVQEQHKSVFSISLADIREVEAAKSKLGGGFLIVRTFTGEEHRFGGIKGDEWSRDLSQALTTQGRTVTPKDGGFTVSPES